MSFQSGSGVSTIIQVVLCGTGGQICAQFISRRTFHQIRMIPPTKFHPCQNFSPNQDDSADQISSLPELSSKSGCFRRLNFISAGTFQQIRMLPQPQNTSLSPKCLIPRRILPRIRMLQQRAHEKTFVFSHALRFSELCFSKVPSNLSLHKLPAKLAHNFPHLPPHSSAWVCRFSAIRCFTGRADYSHSSDRSLSLFRSIPSDSPL